jgi:sec-independent protein translocase protein TatA
MKGLFYFCDMLLFIGGPEIIVVLLFVVMFFGSKKIPELAKGLGKAMREVKDASNEIKKEIRDSATSIKDDFDITK